MGKPIKERCLNPLSANLTKFLNTLKQFVSKLPTNCLSAFDHFVGLALKGLTYVKSIGDFSFIIEMISWKTFYIPSYVQQHFSFTG